MHRGHQKKQDGCAHGHVNVSTKKLKKKEEEEEGNQLKMASSVLRRLSKAPCCPMVSSFLNCPRLPTSLLTALPSRCKFSQDSNDTTTEDTSKLPLNLEGKTIQELLDDAVTDKSEGPKEKDLTEQKRRTRKDPRKSTILLFPGQGAQFVGMARSLLDYPHVEDIFTRAKDILGYDILQLCLNGPQEELNKTVHCQPAVFLTSLAAVERLREDNPMAVETCVAAAGFSVGEYAALVFSGALSFEEALYVVKERAAAMQRASEEAPSGLLSVMGRPQTKFPQLCHDARIYCREVHHMEDPVCSIANYLYPQARVIGGNKECLPYIRKNGKKYGLARMKPVPVSGAFHTSLMQSAQDATHKALREVDIEVPVINVHSNVDASSYQNPHQMRRLLTQQVTSPVRWEQLMHVLYERPQGQEFPDTFEVGPGSQLGAVLSRCNMKARKEYQKVSCGEEDDYTNVQATAND
ncbi:MCAT [Branchiostoma lanceolatum]|uniref:Malonyl-CoA-acyl carrier protein transacylase, mitochondrial n=1 Tax=Branchiostoma lanceolatum TaxID=7740 RepID=A0A8K0EXM7_BRALA|nr:MCAT [Branchiostoma lanceolatum]